MELPAAAVCRGFELALMFKERKRALEMKAEDVRLRQVLAVAFSLSGDSAPTLLRSASSDHARRRARP